MAVMRDKAWWRDMPLWNAIPGMFNFQAIYDEQIARVTGPATFVEVGCWLGRSTAYLALAIRRSGKPITLYAIDTWKGAPNRPGMQAAVRRMGGDMLPAWRRNLERACGADVFDFVTPIQARSVDTLDRFADSSLEFVFLDGDHSFANVVAELRGFAPKMTPAGVLAGHDYDQDEVARAVQQELAGRFTVRAKSWIRQNDYSQASRSSSHNAMSPNTINSP